MFAVLVMIWFAPTSLAVTALAAIEFATTATGTMEDNLGRTDTQAACIDMGSMTDNNNLWDDEDTGDTVQFECRGDTLHTEGPLNDGLPGRPAAQVIQARPDQEQ